MAIGHFLMAFEGTFLLALFSLVVGVGLFKGNIATQVGALYKDTDLRRAMAFQIFYIAINASVIVAPLVSGTLGEKIGWHWGFGTAGVVMVLGLIIYLSGKKWLPADDFHPETVTDAPAPRQKMTRNDWTRTLALMLLIPVMAISLLTNQEIFNAYLVWGDEQFQLKFSGTTLPTSWLITLDATLSFAMLVAVAAFWKWWGKTRNEPDELGKMIIGSFFTIAGGLCLFMAAFTQAPGTKIGLAWPFMFHLLNSIGFANILPVSLALFTKVAPKSITATVVGLYYLAFFAANAIVGYVGGLYSSLPTPTFWLLHVASAAFGLIAFIAFKIFVAARMAHAPEPMTASGSSRTIERHERPADCGPRPHRSAQSRAADSARRQFAPVVGGIACGGARMHALRPLQMWHPDGVWRRSAGRQNSFPRGAARRPGGPCRAPVRRACRAAVRRSAGEGWDRPRADLRHQCGQAFQIRSAWQEANPRHAQQRRDHRLPLVAGTGARIDQAAGHRGARGDGGAVPVRQGSHHHQAARRAASACRRQ
jgi:POT family proton-dependent oligopeptide transporter